MQNTSTSLAKELAKDCRTIEDIQEKLKDLFKDTLQQVFEAEMEHHLGYPKNASDGINSGNNRNGYSKKTVKTRAGETEIEIPRDRKSEFEPQIIRKYQTTANELEDRIVAMYAKGLRWTQLSRHFFLDFKRHWVKREWKGLSKYPRFLDYADCCGK